MKLAEHVPNQGKWQVARRIDEAINGRWGTTRIGVEVGEAAAETDPLKALEELIDVLIITFGGMYEAANAAGVPFEELDKMLELKLALNNAKYPIELAGQFATPEEYIAHCRATFDPVAYRKAQGLE